MPIFESSLMNFSNLLPLRRFPIFFKRIRYFLFVCFSHFSQNDLSRFLIRITKIVLKNLRKKCITDSLNVLYDPFNKSLMTMLFDLFLATQLETIFSVLYCFESTLLIQNITFEWVASHKPFEI